MRKADARRRRAAKSSDQVIDLAPDGATSSRRRSRETHLQPQSRRHRFESCDGKNYINRPRKLTRWRLCFGDQMVTAPSLCPFFQESRAGNFELSRQRAEPLEALSSVGGNGPPNDNKRARQRKRRAAGLSFIPIQKNPRFSIKRNVTVFSSYPELRIFEKKRR